MDTAKTITLDDRLRFACAVWCRANDAKPGRLGRLAINDGGFFSRLENNPGASTTTATLEKFARFLADPENWPDGVVAEEAKSLAHVTGVSAPVARSSAGLAGKSSSREKAA